MNKALLDYEMRVRGLRKKDLYTAINISKASYYRKQNGTSDFTGGEIQKIMDTLSSVEPLSYEDAFRIFFAKEVS